MVLSEEQGIEKPKREIFDRAMALLDRKSGECVHIGDSYESDVVGARNAGMWAGWFNPRKLAPPENDITPDFEIGKLSELPGIVSSPLDRQSARG